MLKVRNWLEIPGHGDGLSTLLHNQTVVIVGPFVHRLFVFYELDVRIGCSDAKKSDVQERANVLHVGDRSQKND